MGTDTHLRIPTTSTRNRCRVDGVMRTFLLWSWSLNLLLLLSIYSTATNLSTKIGLFAVGWVVLNTGLHYAAEPFYGRR